MGTSALYRPWLRFSYLVVRKAVFRDQSNEVPDRYGRGRADCREYSG